ncbi:uncharacterized protein [Procambarus clarkii]|uniref:uncharacterized protein n=1 Tax=Procambarus clarkii TaxID=6728 RepID=UPI001E6763E1|nr:uncharacterized protein LOC123767565 [Procambarus clarkii]
MVPQWTSVVVVVLALVSVTSAIKCYQCSNCGTSVGNVQGCNPEYDVCMKLDLPGRIEKACGRSNACGLRTFDRDATIALNTIRTYLGSVDTGIQIPDDNALAKMIKCCDDDLCNSAVSKLINPLLLLLVPLVMYSLQY